MIKNSSFDFSYDYLRFDTTWLFEWDYEQITDDTIKFYPFTETGTNKTWRFKAEADENGKEKSDVTIKHDEFVWDSLEPWLEYHEDEVKQWDASHPNNPTRYLAPGSSFITITNSVETVIIDNVPPAFVSEEDKKKGHEKILAEIIVENFLKMEREIATQVQETQRVPNRKNPR